MNRTIQAAARMAVYFLLLAALVITPHAVAYNLFPVTATGGVSQSIAACATEDSTNCYWDATTHGNGLGQSFLDIDGTAYYFGG